MSEEEVIKQVLKDHLEKAISGLSTPLEKRGPNREWQEKRLVSVKWDNVSIAEDGKSAKVRLSVVVERKGNRLCPTSGPPLRSLDGDYRAMLSDYRGYCQTDASKEYTCELVKHERGWTVHTLNQSLWKWLQLEYVR